MIATPPNHALQRFEGFGKSREGFTGGEGLANSQTERVGTREPTAPRPSRSGCNRGVPRAVPVRKHSLSFCR
jgi:hypothetical protein